MHDYVIDRILKPRYFLSGEAYEAYYGKPGAEKDWSELSRRVAKVVSAVRQSGTQRRAAELDYYETMNKRRFLPNSPTLFGAGVPGLTMSACFVLEMTDSIDGWSDTFHTAMKVQCAGGGCGFPLHKLRPHGWQVRGKNAKAAGPIEWMHCWNIISQTLRQAVRNGANMGLLRIDHPDIEEFIKCKDDKSQLTNFNISVGVTDAFLKALKDQTPFPLLWEGRVVKTVDPKVLWDNIILHAWKTGEPGLLFIDNMNRNNPFRDVVGDLYPNPCAEATLFENSACNLGSINLAAFVYRAPDGSMNFSFDAFAETIKVAYYFLDDLIDANTYPSGKITKVVKDYRQIGLGLMGLADMFVKMDIRYGSSYSVTLTESIMKFFRNKVDAMNRQLCRERGCFPAATKHKKLGKGFSKLRNFTTTCIAPTGTISQIAGCSAGIEPHFSFEGMDRSIAGKRYVVPGPQKSLDASVNVIADELPVADHLAILSTVQRYVDMSVSKTINLPNSATQEEVADAYLKCADLGIKGITVYRDGSRNDQTIITNTSVLKGSEVRTEPTTPTPTPTPTDPPAKSRPTTDFGNITPITRPDPLIGVTHKYKIGCGSLYVTVNKDPVFGRPLEVFVRPGKFGGCPSNVEAIGRLTSLGLRTGIKLEELIKQLSGIRCISCISKKGLGVTSCADAIGKTIKEQMLLAKAAPIPEDVTVTEVVKLPASSAAGCEACVTPCVPKKVLENPATSHDVPKSRACPECGSTLRHYDGCVSCPCGYSKCG